MVDGVAQNMDEVVARFLEQVRVVDRETALGVTQDEHVGEAVHVHAVHRPDAVPPMLGEAVVPGADDVVAGSPGVLGPDLESGGVDQAVERDTARSPTTTPALVIASTPRPSVSTSVTLGRLKAWR